MRHIFSIIALSLLTAAALMIPVDVRAQAADTDETHLKAGHKKVEGVVTDVKSGMYTVKTPTGTMTLSENAAVRHGHGAPKVGDELTLCVSENNMIIDAHAKGDATVHRSVSGKLTLLDNVNSQIKVLTPDGEMSFKLKPETRSFVDITPGTPVTVEVNESGEVIDLHKDKQ